MKIDQKTSENVFHLGTVMVKVIVIFLFSVLSVAAGIIWYRSEVSIITVDEDTSPSTPRVITLPSSPQAGEPSPGRPLGSEVSEFVVSQVNTETGEILVEDPEFGPSSVLVSPVTRIVRITTTAEGEEQTEIQISDIEVGSEIEVIVAGPPRGPRDFIDAQEIIVR